RISPAVGRSSSRMQRPVVVLPQPLSPTSPNVSPRRRVKSTPSTARTSPTRRRARMPSVTGKNLRRLLTSRSVGASVAGAVMRRSGRGAYLVAAQARGQVARRPYRLERRPTLGTGLDREAAARAERAALVEAREVGRLTVHRVEARPARAI